MSSVDQIRSFLGTYGSSWDADQEQWMNQYFGQMQNVPPYAMQHLDGSPSDPYLSHQDTYGTGIQSVQTFLPTHDRYSEQYDYFQPPQVQEIDDVEVEIISQAAFDQAAKKARSNNGTGEQGGSRVDIQMGLSLSLSLSLNPVETTVKNNSNVVVEQGGEAAAAAAAAAYRCPICMDKITEATSTKCGHIFCDGCIKQALALKKQCPTCRRKLRSNSNIKVFLPEIF